MGTKRSDLGASHGLFPGSKARVPLLSESALRPEHELLRLAARTRNAEVAADRARETLLRGVDWPLTLMAAVDHEVMPLLHRNFFVLGPEAAPEEFVRDLRALYLANEYRNLSLTAELVRVLALFEADGLPVVAYGGPLLAASAYGDTAFRQASPLKVLVGHADLGRAASLLAGAGYRMAERLTPRQARSHARHAGALAFVRPEPDAFLHLHWRFVPEFLRGGPDPKTALENRRREPFGGTVAPSLDPDDALLVLALEGTLGRWRRLAMVCDVAELLSSREAWEWPGLLDRARSEGTLRMLLVGVALAAELLSAPVPPEVLALALRKPSVVALRRQAIASLFDTEADPLPTLTAVAFESRSLDATRSRLIHAWKRTVVPGRADWAWLRLPDTLYPLYWVVRPVRLAAALATGLLRRRGPRPGTSARRTRQRRTGSRS